jgi:hypothetical protein
MRALLRGTQDLRRFEPARGSPPAWDAAARRLAGAAPVTDGLD